MNLTTLCPFLISNCLTGKAWVNPMRALLSAIFCRVWGLCFLAWVGKLCLTSHNLMWNTTRVPHCGPCPVLLWKMIRLATNVLFCCLESLFKPDEPQKRAVFRCSVGKLCPPELPLEVTAWCSSLGKRPQLCLNSKDLTGKPDGCHVKDKCGGLSDIHQTWAQPQVTCPCCTIAPQPAPESSVKCCHLQTQMK